MTNRFNAEKDVMVYSAVCNPMIFHEINDTIIDLIVKKHIKKIFLFDKKTSTYNFYRIKRSQDNNIKTILCNTKVKIMSFFSQKY